MGVIVLPNLNSNSGLQKAIIDLNDYAASYQDIVDYVADTTAAYKVSSSIRIDSTTAGHPTDILLTKSNKFHYVEVVSSSAAMTLKLPVGDLANTNIEPNDIFVIKDSSENSETYAITVSLNGGRIIGASVSSTNPVIAKNKGFIWLRYVGWDSVNNWGLWEVIFADLTAILYSKFNPVGANAAWATAYSGFSAIFGGNVLAAANGVNGGGFFGLSYRGSIASPSGSQNGDLLGHFRGMGCEGTGFSTGGSLQFSATQNWNSTERGTLCSIRNITNGTTTLGTVVTFGQDKLTTFTGGLRFNVNNTHTMFTASIAPSDTYGFNAFTTISDIRLKQLIETFMLNDELLDKLIESECFISWIWKDFENQEIFETEKQIIIDAETKEEREIEVPVLVQSYYKSNHKRRHTGSNAFRVLKVLIEMGISTEDFPIISIENYKPELIDLIRNMTEEEFINTPESVIGRLSIKNELYIPLMANAIYRQKQRLTSLESRLSRVEALLFENLGV